MLRWRRLRWRGCGDGGAGAHSHGRGADARVAVNVGGGSAIQHSTVKSPTVESQFATFLHTVESKKRWAASLCVCVWGGFTLQTFLHPRGVPCAVEMHLQVLFAAVGVFGFSIWCGRHSVDHRQRRQPLSSRTAPIHVLTGSAASAASVVAWVGLHAGRYVPRYRHPRTLPSAWLWHAPRPSAMPDDHRHRHPEGSLGGGDGATCGSQRGIGIHLQRF
jgi:hypothetical protein